MHVEITRNEQLRFDDGSAVRAASAATRLRGDWVIAQDDANHAALWSVGHARRLRLFPPIDGHDAFSEAQGTKDHKPDIEAACTVEVDGAPAALLLGSGSLPNRMRAALVRTTDAGWDVVTRDLSALYANVVTALEISADALNLEGACLVGTRLRWFQRGHANGVPSAAVDLDVSALLDAMAGGAHPGDVAVRLAGAYDLGEVDGVPLAVTDAVTLPDGRILVSAAAEDAPDAVADGPIVGSALALIDDRRVVDCVELATAPSGDVWKVEGLGLAAVDGTHARLLGVVDQDDPDQPSTALHLTVTLD